MSFTHTQAELANFIGKSTRTIREYQEKGIISKGGNNKYDIAVCVRDIINHLAEVAAGRKSEEDGLDITAERARLAKEQADKIAMENEVARGELLDSGEVETGVIIVVSNMRTRLLSLPAKIGPEVAIKKDVAICADILTTGIYECLDEISKIEINKSFKIVPVCRSCGHAFGMPVNPAPAVKANRKPVGRPKKTTKPGSQRRTGKIPHQPG